MPGPGPNPGAGFTTYSYYHSDHLGSSNITTDENANITQHLEYTPYGRTAHDEKFTVPGFPPPEIKHKFTGKELDSTTGLY